MLMVLLHGLYLQVICSCHLISLLLGLLLCLGAPSQPLVLWHVDINYFAHYFVLEHFPINSILEHPSSKFGHLPLEQYIIYHLVTMSHGRIFEIITSSSHLYLLYLLCFLISNTVCITIHYV
jgi:hypothetical protein